jgi:hypothetical protein
MPYWEFELTLKECEKIAEEDKKRQEDENGQYSPPNMNQYQRQTNQMMRTYQSKLPSIPSAPKMPKF